MKIKSKYQFNGLAECNIEKAVYAKGKVHV